MKTEQSDSDFKKMTREWEEILDKMILAFEYHHKDGNDIDFGFIDYEITEDKKFDIKTDEEQYKKGRGRGTTPRTNNGRRVWIICQVLSIVVGLILTAKKRR